MSRNKGNFLCPADYFVQQPCGAALRLPCGVSVDVHSGIDIRVAQQLLSISIWQTVALLYSFSSDRPVSHSGVVSKAEAIVEQYNLDLAAWERQVKEERKTKQRPPEKESVLKKLWAYETEAKQQKAPSRRKPQRRHLDMER